VFTVTYDRDGHALYLRIDAAAVARSEVLSDGGTVLDLDGEGRVVGVEVLAPGRDWPVDEVIARIGADGADADGIRGVYDARSRYSPGRTFAAG
jgi:uncharacterized protein YuzE